MVGASGTPKTRSGKAPHPVAGVLTSRLGAFFLAGFGADSIHTPHNKSNLVWPTRLRHDLRLVLRHVLGSIWLG